MDLKDFSKWFFSILLAVVIVFALSTLGFCLYKTIGSDGQIDYCYVEVETTPKIPVYSLWGFRSWCSNRLITSSYKLDDVVEASTKLQCPLRSK